MSSLAPRKWDRGEAAGGGGELTRRPTSARRLVEPAVWFTCHLQILPVKPHSALHRRRCVWTARPLLREKLTEVQMLPATSQRVPLHTSDRSNNRIRSRTLESVEFYAAHPEQIEQRLRELDEEWDVERALEVNGSVLAGTGIALAARFSRWWLLLPGAVVTFCLQHALQGWCPPLPLFRRLGLRTQREIDDERTTLKAIRGDFREAEPDEDPHHRSQAMLQRAQS